jgi:hypothetical protein
MTLKITHWAMLCDQKKLLKLECEIKINSTQYQVDTIKLAVKDNK